MGFRHEDFKLRFIETTGLNPIVGFHSRFRWFFLRHPCGAFILHGIKDKRRFIFIYFQGGDWKAGVFRTRIEGKSQDKSKEK